MNRGTWQTTVHGVAKSQTLLSNQAQHPDPYIDKLEKTLTLGKIDSRRRGEQEHQMVGWHH